MIYKLKIIFKEPQWPTFSDLKTASEINGLTRKLEYRNSRGKEQSGLKGFMLHSSITNFKELSLR